MHDLDVCMQIYPLKYRHYILTILLWGSTSPHHEWAVPVSASVIAFQFQDISLWRNAQTVVAYKAYACTWMWTVSARYTYDTDGWHLQEHTHRHDLPGCHWSILLVVEVIVEILIYWRCHLSTISIVPHGKAMSWSIYEGTSHRSMHDEIERCLEWHAH